MMQETEEEEEGNDNNVFTELRRMEEPARPLIALAGEEKLLWEVEEALGSFTLPARSVRFSDATFLRSQKSGSSGSKDGCFKPSWLRKHNAQAPTAVLHAILLSDDFDDALGAFEASRQLAETEGARLVALLAGPAEAEEERRQAMGRALGLESKCIVAATSTDVGLGTDQARRVALAAVHAAAGKCDTEEERNQRKSSAKPDDLCLKCRSLLKAGLWAERKGDYLSSSRYLRDAHAISCRGIDVDSGGRSECLVRWEELCVASFAARRGIRLLTEVGEFDEAVALAKFHARALVPGPSSRRCFFALCSVESSRMAQLLGDCPASRQHLANAARLAVRVVGDHASPCSDAPPLVVDGEWLGQPRRAGEDRSWPSDDELDRAAVRDLLELFGSTGVLERALSACAMELTGKRAKGKGRWASLALTRAHDLVRQGRYADVSDGFDDDEHPMHLLREGRWWQAWASALKAVRGARADGGKSLARCELELACIREALPDKERYSLLAAAMERARSSSLPFAKLCFHQGAPIRAKACFFFLNGESHRVRVLAAVRSELPGALHVEGICAEVGDASSGVGIATLWRRCSEWEVSPGKWESVELYLPEAALKRPAIVADVFEVGLQVARGRRCVLAVRGGCGERALQPGFARRCIERRCRGRLRQLFEPPAELPEPVDGAELKVEAPRVGLRGEEWQVSARVRALADGVQNGSVRLAVQPPGMMRLSEEEVEMSLGRALRPGEEAVVVARGRLMEAQAVRVEAALHYTNDSGEARACKAAAEAEVEEAVIASAEPLESPERSALGKGKEVALVAVRVSPGTDDADVDVEACEAEGWTCYGAPLALSKGREGRLVLVPEREGTQRASTAVVIWKRMGAMSGTGGRKEVHLEEGGGASSPPEVLIGMKAPTGGRRKEPMPAGLVVEGTEVLQGRRGVSLSLGPVGPFLVAGRRRMRVVVGPGERVEEHVGLIPSESGLLTLPDLSASDHLGQAQVIPGSSSAVLVSP